ncbi:hypothetical protein [Paenibacillus sp. LjRoot153]|uniref:hypothetical protein n=1 Tax=Paenibacillus sp. LjRoot153 TaxID=3342270 RepID=UPI003F503050
MIWVISNPFDIQHVPSPLPLRICEKDKKRPQSDWDEERSARGATQLDDDMNGHHPLGSAITGGAGLFREGPYILPIMNVSELEALH